MTYGNTSSYNTLIQAVANQIYPIVEGFYFYFDSAGEVMTALLKTNKAIKRMVILRTSNDIIEEKVYE